MGQDNSEIDGWDTDDCEGECEEVYNEIKYEIFSYPSDTTLKGYQDQKKSEQLSIPSFQRQFVWDIARASKLIESFLLGLPVPPVFLYKKMKSKEFLIVDGQQRIESIVRFLDGEFNGRTFKLKNVNEKWDGKSFVELDETDRFSLETSVLRAIVIQQTNPEDITSIYQIFERLNTGGVRLNCMEVRQCISSGFLLDKIKEENENRNWRKVLGYDRPDKRLRDRELLLRVFSLSLHRNEYQKPMKGFLNKIADKYKEETHDGLKVKGRLYSVEKIKSFFRRFENVVSEIHNQLGDKPFHLKSRLNYGFLDSVVAVLCEEGRSLDDLKAKIDRIKNDQEYVKSITISTSDDESVKVRFEKVNEVF